MALKPEQPDQWANRILSSAEPFLAAVTRPTVTVEAPMDADVSALQDALSRIRALLLNPSPDANHDLLNLIGAIRGYAEMLHEDVAELHPALQSALPALLSSVEGTEQYSVPPTLSTASPLSEAPGVILAVDDMPENRELISRLLSRAGHTVISAV